MADHILGVLGGLGPGATAHFLSLVTEMTDVPTDQGHITSIIYSVPSTPDRTQYILDASQPNPLPQMLAIGQRLVALGADQIAIPCFTAHYFYDTLSSQIPAQIINGVQETAAYLHGQGVRRAGIMATDGTIRTGIFHRELEKLGITPIVPDAERQADVMSLIFRNVKAGIPADMTRFSAVRQALLDSGAEAIILGCTELSLVKRDNPIDSGCIDAMEVLARCAVLNCEKPLKDRYRDLITK